jgi:nucleotide-binding universal stress UspA family protein
MQQLIRYILVPTDFSQESASALSVAAEISRRTDAQIVLLHVVDSLLYKSVWATDEIEWDNKNVQNFAIYQIIKELKLKLIHFAAKYSDDRIVEPCIAFQNIYTAIQDYAKKYENCLIVMGSKGTGETSFLIGSNTENIIRAANSPVLVVKGKINKFQLTKICFAADFEANHIPWVVISFVKLLQHIFSAHLQLLKVITPQYFELSSHTQQALQAFAKQHDLQNYSTNFYNHYTEYEGILAFANDTKTDLVCMTTHGSTGFMQIMMGSIAEDVANHAQIPVLTFKI